MPAFRRLTGCRLLWTFPSAEALRWSRGNVTHELDLLGFHVVEIRMGKRTQQNQELIPCSQCATGLEASYSFSVARHRGGRKIFVELVREGGVVETVGPAEWRIPGLGKVPPRQPEARR